GRGWTSQGGDGRSVSDHLAAQVVPRRGIVGFHNRRETGGRPGGPARSHVFVHLSGVPVPILVVPEVDVVLTVYRLHAEPAADLHGRGMVLPLLKGNIRMGESVLDPLGRAFPIRVQVRAWLCARHGRLPEVRRGDGGRVPRRAGVAFRDPVVSVEELLRTPWGADRGERPHADVLARGVPLFELSDPSRLVLRTSYSPPRLSAAGCTSRSSPTCTRPCPRRRPSSRTWTGSPPPGSGSPATSSGTIRGRTRSCRSCGTGG